MKCNHTIGLTKLDSGYMPINTSELIKYRGLPDIRFQFCPDCGEYLGDYLLDSVDEILEQLNRKKGIEDHEKWLAQQVAALNSPEFTPVPAAGLSYAMGRYVIKEKIR